MKRATLLIEFTKDKKYNLQLYLCNTKEYLLKCKLNLEIDSILFSFEDSFFVNQLLDKTLKLILWDTNVWIVKRKKYSVRILLRLFYSSAAVGDWIMKPVEYCSLGIQDEIWSMRKRVQCSPIVYLALSSEVRVTRENKYLRWIDQGAIEAVSIVEVPNRYLAV
jgi:hypothetical protein